MSKREKKVCYEVLSSFLGDFPRKLVIKDQVRIQGGGPEARAPPLTLGFEAPKLSIFGPYLILP